MKKGLLCFSSHFKWFQSDCRVVGPHRDQLLGEVGHRKFDCAYPKLSLGGCWAIGKSWDTAPGVGKHSLRWGTAGAGLGVPQAHGKAVGIWFTWTPRHRWEPRKS